jgi:hypothetical protein
MSTLVDGKWLRCSEARIESETLYYTLDFEKEYDIVKSYPRDPHVEFLRAESNGALVSFVRRWGPFYIPNEASATAASWAHPVALYRKPQRSLGVLVNLLNAARRKENERQAVTDQLTVELEDWDVQGEPIMVLALRHYGHIEGDIFDWLKNANTRQIRWALDLCIASVSFADGWPAFVCHRQAGKTEIEAKWTMTSLEDALKWMVWYDEFNRHPIVCCRECRKVFRPDTAHERLYCSYECAHRVAARNWQRKTRRTSRRENVTRKAR